MPQTLQVKDWIEVALQYIDSPASRYLGPDGSNKPGIFDCSGFVQWVLVEARITIPNLPGTDRMIRHAGEFFDHFGVLVHPNAAKRGDIVFSTRNGVYPTHIGFYLGNNQVIHSPGRRNTLIAIRDLEQVFGKPIKYDSSQGERQYFANPIGFKRPSILVPGERYQQVLTL